MNFIEECRKIDIEINKDMLDRFNTYYDFLTYYNQFVNLTSIKDYEEVFFKHFYDSLTIKKYVNDSKTLLDVGSGAGFPSVPLAIVSDRINVTIIDALNKRIVFLNELTKKLNLKNVNSYHFRAEEFVKDHRETFDCVTARAVARLNILLELCMPLVKVGGYFIAMKSQGAKEELEESANAIKVLKGEVVEVVELDLPNNYGKREIIIIKKISNIINKYPRSFNTIKKKPL